MNPQGAASPRTRARSRTGRNDMTRQGGAIVAVRRQSGKWRRFERRGLPRAVVRRGGRRSSSCGADEDPSILAIVQNGFWAG